MSVDVDNYPNLASVDPIVRSALIRKCQHNEWLMRGGYSWQDDPFLEEYPYDFVIAENLEELRSYFAYGNMAIRQGVLYDDLAFIQQVNGGDEWWTLKLLGNAADASNWLEFENWSLYRTAIASDKEQSNEFNRYIRSMQMASPEQCKHLDYMLPDTSPVWDCSDLEGVVVGKYDLRPRLFSASTESFKLKITSYPQLGAKGAILSHDSNDLICEIPYQDSALEAAKVTLATAEVYKKGIVIGAEGRHQFPLKDKGLQAREGSLMLSKDDIDFLSTVLSK